MTTVAEATTSRTKNSIRNVTAVILAQMLGIIASFVCRTVFIYTLGANYLGIGGLFLNIINILSIANMGIAGAIGYSLYKPLAEKDYKKVKALVQIYKKSYHLIGCFIGVAGVTLLPFYRIFIKGGRVDGIPHLDSIFILFVVNAMVQYFFVYNRAVLIMDQKRYIDSLNTIIFTFLMNTSQIIFLLLTRNYLGYLMLQIVFNVTSNYVISRKIYKIYPFLRESGIVNLEEEEKRILKKNIFVMIGSKVGDVIFSSSNNIVISTYVGIYWVGLYSNYQMITAMAATILAQLFSAITASVGHLNATESKERSYSIFKNTFFMNFWIYGFVCTALWCLLNPFITLWVGTKYLLDDAVVSVIVLMFFLLGMRQSVLMYRDTLGLFWQDRFRPIVECALNLFLSIVLTNYFGMVGALLGGIISILLVGFWQQPYVLYRYGFNKPLLSYFSKYFHYLVVAIMAALLSRFICSQFSTVTIGTLLLRIGVCLIIPNVFFISLFYKTEEFKFFANIISNIGWKYFKRLFT